MVIGDFLFLNHCADGHAGGNDNQNEYTKYPISRTESKHF